MNRRPGARFNRGRIATAGGEWNPASLTSAALHSDHDARKGITFRDTLSDCSGTGDPITLTGTLGPYATTPHDIRVDITTAGLPNAGKFRGSLNSGHDYVIDGGVYDQPIPVGLTYAIPGTLITLNFANVSYNLNAIYYAQVESWADQSGNGHTFTRQPANAGPLLQRMGRTNNGFSRLSKGVMGRWALVADAAHVLENAGTWAADLAGGTNNTFHIFVVASSDLPGAAAQSVVAVGRASTAVPFLYLGEDGLSDWAHTWRNDSNVTGNANSSGDVGNTRVHVFEIEYDGTNSITRIDGVQVGSSAVARGAMTVDRAGIFALIRNTVANRAKASITRILAYSGNLSAGDAATARTQLKAIHDVATPKTIRVSYDGDSWFAPGNGNAAPPNVMLHGNDTVTVVNAAVSGSVIADLVARAATIDANYSAGADGNILFVHVGMNDCQGAASAATIEADIRSYITARRAVGWHVVIDTLRDREDAVGGYAAKRATINTNIRADSLGANAHVDSDLNAPGALADGLWYAQDGVGHPTAPEASREADLNEVEYRAYVDPL